MIPRVFVCFSETMRPTVHRYLRTSTKRYLSSGGDKPKQSFHKRPLPSNLVALSSSEGKKLFREALGEGTLESYFPLAEQFITQSDPSYCSLSTLAMVLNALNFDPKRVWKGSWRWVSEEMLQCETRSLCGHSLEKVKNHGLGFLEFESLARCHGVNISSKQVTSMTEQVHGVRDFKEFKYLIEEISSADQAKSFIVTNFSRKYLNQTGDGHYSPVAGCHRKRGLVLILDVARFKYPPYWVPMEDLWNSMAVKDASTGQSRGYFIISTSDQIASDTSSSTCTQQHHHSHSHCQSHRHSHHHHH
jgi:glutathione gamma-glutamylcysteinyltransferase